MTTEIKSGLYFSPGFYMAYWHGCVLKQFPIKTVETHTAMTKYRELFVGSILAAANTLASGMEFYVGLPPDEPPDVDLMYMEPIKVNGKDGVKRKHLYVEIVRCNMGASETIQGQALKKNKPAYKDMIVAIFMEGSVPKVDYPAIEAALKNEAVIYPSEILLVMNADMAGPLMLPAGSFGLSRLYPKPGSSIVNLNDNKAFFRTTDVVGDAAPRMGVSAEWQDLGPLTIAPPKL